MNGLLAKTVAAIWTDTPHSASRNFLVTSIFWLLFGVTFGLIAGALMVWPDLTKGVAQLTFGKVRPLHINSILVARASLEPNARTVLSQGTKTRSRLRLHRVCPEMLAASAILE